MTKQLFLDSGLVPDPHEALYSPGVLGDGENYLEFWSLTSGVSWVRMNWFLTSSNTSSDLSSHYAAMVMDISLDTLRQSYGARWFYSQFFEWLYISGQGIKQKEADQSVNELYAWIEKDFGINSSSTEKIGWIIMLREWSEISSITITETQTIVDVDFTILRGGTIYGVKLDGTEVKFIDSNNGDIYNLYNSTGGSSESPGDTPTITTPIPDFAQPPQPVLNYPQGFKESNVICCGYNNKIYKSRRCTIINGKNVYIGKTTEETADIGQCNCTVIGGIFGSQTQFRQSNAFYVHCDNGLHVIGGDVVSLRLSDQSLKENKTKIKNATDKIKKIKAVSFDWNQNQETYTGHDIGLIAQDVEKVIPEAVSNRKNGFKGVQYHKVIPLLAASIQEKQKRINNLKEKIERLKNGKL
jgi:hypothetical protein